MSKHDLRARPIYHHKRGSIEALLKPEPSQVTRVRIVI
jgi:hypothetical protein